MAETTVSGLIGDREITFGAGKFAQLADGAVVVKLGGTEVLVSATASRRLREGVSREAALLAFEAIKSSIDPS